MSVMSLLTWQSHYKEREEGECPTETGLSKPTYTHAVDIITDVAAMS